MKKQELNAERMKFKIKCKIFSEEFLKAISAAAKSLNEAALEIRNKFAYVGKNSNKKGEADGENKI
jgi:hypothetical protein